MEETISTNPISPAPLVTGPPSGKGREGNGRPDSRGPRKPVRRSRQSEEPKVDDALAPLEVDTGKKGANIDLTV